jgi:hypothetical protein
MYQKHFLQLTFIALLFDTACQPVNQPEGKKPIPIAQEEKKQPSTPHLTPIEGTNLGIQIPPGYELKYEKGSDFLLIHLVPVLKNTEKESEAGLYIGNMPNWRKPTEQFTETEIAGILLGSPVTWTHYKTNRWWQLETFIPYQSDKLQTLHIWCYAWSESDMNAMQQTLQTLTKL